MRLTLRSDSKRKSGIGKMWMPALTMKEIARPSRTCEPAAGCWPITTSTGYRSLGRRARTVQAKCRRAHSSFASATACPENVGKSTSPVLPPQKSCTERANQTITATKNASARANSQSRSSSFCGDERCGAAPSVTADALSRQQRLQRRFVEVGVAVDAMHVFVFFERVEEREHFVGVGGARTHRLFGFHRKLRGENPQSGGLQVVLDGHQARGFRHDLGRFAEADVD